MNEDYIRTPSFAGSMPVDISFAFGDERPAGKHGFLKTDGEVLRFEDGTIARFWGVCMNGSACFPSHEYSERVAERLMMTGVNIVRLHQLDGEFHTPNIFSFHKGQRLKSTRVFDPRSLDALDYFVKCLKDHGIYCYLDNMVFRHFKSGDGVAYADELHGLHYYTGRPYSLFDPVMIERQKEYSTNLWTHFNPYTGLQYKDDPVFVLSEIVNEGTLWFGGYHPAKGEKPIPQVAYYENELKELFLAWAKDHEIAVDAEKADVWDLDDPNVNQFKLELIWKYNQTMYDHLRSIGVRIPLTGSNMLGSTGSYAVYAQKNARDYMDNHHYYYDWAWGEFDKIAVNKPINGNPSILPGLPKMRVKGLPFFVSEWGMPYPNSYRAEGPVYYAAVGALQGWSGMTIHTYAYGTNLDQVDMIGKQYSSSTLGGISYREGVFSAWNDPSVWGLFYHSALMLRRADLSPANKTVGIREPLSMSVPGKAYSTGVEVHRLVSILDGSDEKGVDEVINCSDAIPWENPNRIVSDNGQMWRDLALKFGGIDTERTKILYGKLGKHGRAGARIQAVPGTEVKGFKVESRTDFAVIALSSLTDDPISKSDNLLLTTVGRSRNTDSQFDGERLVEYGHAPIVSQVIHAKLTIETERTDLIVWGINEEGILTGIVPATFKDGKMTFTLGEDYPSLHYLIAAE
ncbi:MAG: hypothetical protein J5794_08180 [Lachnospiraceae bacterium]|nr:hypothetical protein [Lachnospiraceae bacterium]